MYFNKTYFLKKSGVRLGLFENEKLGRNGSVIYDVLIMFTSLLQVYCLTKLGIYEKREEDIESIAKAIERVVFFYFC